MRCQGLICLHAAGWPGVSIAGVVYASMVYRSSGSLGHYPSLIRKYLNFLSFQAVR